MTNNQFIVGDSKVGKGLFANKSFNAGDIVFHFAGKPGSSKDFQDLSKEDQNNLLQIGADLFLDLRKEYGLFINHHCNPNSWVKIACNTAFLVANRDINKGDEITCDYSLTSTDTPESWLMKCDCHRFYCRKTISGFFSMPEKKQQEIINEKKVPGYILKLNDKT
jgi:uncharacterized protein